MKDGTGSLAAGEEEAFKKKFPSADLEDDLIQWQPTDMSPTTSYGNDSQARDQGSKSQYLSPSQRAREAGSGYRGDSGATQDDEEEEEEEEKLIRRRRHQSPTNGGLQSRGEAEESGTPAESVRERVLRMNRVGRVA